MPEKHKRREYAATVYVLNEDRSALLFKRRKKHPFLGWYLPPGGHVEQNETPDEAAVREVMEETGYTVHLIGHPFYDEPEDGVTELTLPFLIQLESIDLEHDHIDMIYIGMIQGEKGAIADGDEGGVWLDLSALKSKPMPQNVRKTALHILGQSIFTENGDAYLQRRLLCTMNQMRSRG
ncbi:NUDIX domain-containing protein [Metabacillus arenae]|nr:NUDIX hydrolase [Metabacillus arenae]